MPLNNFFYEKEVPYYIPCMYPLVHENLKNNNMNSYLSLHTNISLLGLPTFCKNNDSTSFKINISAYNVNRLGYKFRGEYLGFDLKIFEFQNIKEGFELLKFKVKNNKAVIVSGSQYYLPYCNNYKNDNYIKNYPNPLFGVVNHWLSVYDIEKDKVFVRDTTFNYIGDIAEKDFLAFWKGDKQLDDLGCFPGVSGLLKYGYTDIQINNGLSLAEYNELFLKTLKTVTYEYLAGKCLKDEGGRFYFGKAALDELYSILSHLLGSEMKQEVLESFNNCLYNMRFNRFIFRDLLLELKNIFAGEYQEFYTIFNEIVSKLENVSYIFAVSLKRNKINSETIQMILSIFKDYIDNEISFFEKLFESHKDIPLLDKM